MGEDISKLSFFCFLFFYAWSLPVLIGLIDGLEISAVEEFGLQCLIIDGRLKYIKGFGINGQTIVKAAF